MKTSRAVILLAVQSHFSDDADPSTSRLDLSILVVVHFRTHYLHTAMLLVSRNHYARVS
jgi:hypothetical protein